MHLAPEIFGTFHALASHQNSSQSNLLDGYHRPIRFRRVHTSYETSNITAHLCAWEGDISIMEATCPRTCYHLVGEDISPNASSSVIRRLPTPNPATLLRLKRRALSARRILLVLSGIRYLSVFYMRGAADCITSASYIRPRGGLFPSSTEGQFHIP